MTGRSKGWGLGLATLGMINGALLGEARKPPAITTKNVPTVSAELVDRLTQYQNTRTATFLGWAPDGDGVLIATRFGNTSQLHRVRQPDGRREQVTFFNEPASGRFLPGRTPAGDLLVVLNASGAENYQLFYLDHATGRTTLLTDGKSRNELGPVRRDGSRAMVASNQRNGKDTDLYVLDPRRPNSMEMILQTNNEMWQPMDWSADGKWALLNRYVSINETYPALLNLETKEKTPLPAPADAKGKIAFGDLAFAPDGKTVYLTTDAQGEFRQLARVQRDTGKYEWLTADIPWDVESLTVEKSTGDVAFVVNVDGQSELYLLRGARKVALLDGGAAAGVIDHPRFSPDGKSLAFTLARANAPADVYSLAVPQGDLATTKPGQLVRWTKSETGGLPESTFVKPSLVRFPSFDQRQIPAFVFRPKTASAQKPAPVLISIHGGPESQYRPIFEGVSQFFVNELGVAVINPNVRGSDGYGKTYLTLDNAEKREDSVQDIGALLDWIATQPDLDSKRVAVIGGSYGGYMVLASLTHFGDRIRAGVDIVGIANFITFLEKTAPYRRDLRRAEYGDERDPKMRSVFEQISPANNAEKIRSALLVIHGKNDPRVPFAEAEQIAAKVEKVGGRPWTVYADNEGHGFQKKENRDYMTQVIALFLSESLQTAR